MDIAEYLPLLGVVVGSNGISAILSSLITRRKVRADATATNIQSILDIDQRLSERIAKLEERVAALEKENLDLKQKELSLVHDREINLARIADLEVQNEALEQENEELRLENSILREELAEAQEERDVN